LNGETLLELENLEKTRSKGGVTFELRVPSLKIRAGEPTAAVDYPTAQEISGIFRELTSGYPMSMPGWNASAANWECCGSWAFRASAFCASRCIRRFS